VPRNNLLHTLRLFLTFEPVSTLEAIHAELKELRAATDAEAGLSRPFLSYAQAAILAHCHHATIERLICAGRLKKCGVSTNRPLVRRDELVSLLEAGQLGNVEQQANEVRGSK
jgi:hypothetical protein